MTANASLSDAGVLLSAAFAHTDAANAAAPKAPDTHARMNSHLQYREMFMQD
jgi:hypothetical protein